MRGRISRLNWGWVVVAAGFYCVAMVGGVGDMMMMMMMVNDVDDDRLATSLASS